jgi:peptide/nickel transport system permease protein
MRPARVLSRTLSGITVLLIVFAASRAMILSLPGDPIDTLLAETGTSLPREELRAELGLDRPFLLSLLDDVKAAGKGDLGRSILSRQPIAPLLVERFSRTVLLALLALTLGLSASLVLGILAAANPRGRTGIWANRICTVHGAISAALPTPWLGPLLIYCFAVALPIFPLGGHPALPALALALAFSGLWSRIIRERVRETLEFGAAPGARARGIAEWRVALKYGFAPASGALLAYLGTQAGSLMAGAFVTEVIFDWPGLGSLLVDAVLKRDYPVVQAAIFVGAAASLIGTWSGDALQAWMDPRSAQE